MADRLNDEEVAKQEEEKQQRAQLWAENATAKEAEARMKLMQRQQGLFT